MSTKSPQKSRTKTKRTVKREPLNNVVPLQPWVTLPARAGEVNMEAVAIADDLLTRAKSGEISDLAGVLVRPNGTTGYFCACSRHKWTLLGILTAFSTKLQNDIWGDR